ETLTPLVRPPGSPASLDDFLYQDRGQIGLHVVTFADATLVVLYYTHTTMDLMGWSALMTAWTHMIHGRDELVATPVGLETGDSGGFDPLASLGTAPKERHVLADRQMGVASIAGWGLRNALDLGVRAKE